MPAGIPKNAVRCVCGSDRGSPRDGLCIRCRNRKNLTRYRFTPEQDALLRHAYTAINRKTLTARLKAFMETTRYPFGTTHRRAKQLGLKFEAKQMWTKAEERYLLNNAGELSIADMAAALKRSHDSIQNKVARMGFSGRVRRDGYTRQELSMALGVSEVTLRGWLNRRWFSVDFDRITPGSVRRFLRERLMELNLARCDQEWLKGELMEMLKFGGYAEEEMAA